MSACGGAMKMTTVAPIFPVIVLVLLAVAPSAHAECAWMLWFSRGGGELVDSAFPSLADCDKALLLARDALTEQGYKVSGEGVARGMHLIVGTKDAERISYRCLPDTIDPRGPEGK